MSKEFGERVLQLLQKHNISQRELAASIDINECVLSRYLKGEREPKSEVVAKIAVQLTTTSDYLLGNEESEGEFYFPKVKIMLARNANNLTDNEKKELIAALFGEN